MRIVHKLTLALLPFVALALGLSGWGSLQREEALLERGVRREERRWGRCAAAFLQQVWLDEGEDGARRLLERASPLLEDLRMRWVSTDPQERDPALAPLAPVDALSGISRGEVVAVELPAAGELPERIVTYVPLGAEGERWVALELEESLEEKQALARETAMAVGGFSVATAGLFLLISLLGGRYLVGRPTTRLLAFARRIGKGHFSERLSMPTHDEFGVLAGELNGMCDRLEEARAQVLAESTQRVEALERLHHADRLAALGRIAAGVAHELGTPLNVAQGYADIIAEGDLEPERARALGEKIGRVCRRMTTTIRVTLDYARRRGPDKRPHDLVRLIANVSELTQQLARRRNVDLVVQTSETLRLELDGGQIEQALTNLVVNALQATAAGGRVELALAEESRVAPPERGLTDRARLVACVSVQDEGEGIPPENLDRLYELFFTTREPGQGTGLGLPLAREIVESHGGWIEVKSEPGSGTRFEVLLPLKKAPEISLA